MVLRQFFNQVAATFFTENLLVVIGQFPQRKLPRNPSPDSNAIQNPNPTQGFIFFHKH